MEISSNVLKVGLYELALIVRESGSRGSHRLVFANGKNLHLEARRFQGRGLIQKRLHHTNGSDLG